MLLFQKRFHDGLVSGAVTVTFRRWDKPHVKPGGRYRCHPIGVLEVSAVEQTTVGALTHRDARASGFADRDELLAYLSSGPGGAVDPTTHLWKVTLHHGGDGDRIGLALETDLTADDVALIKTKLARLDAAEPWTKKTLAIIGKYPRVAASQLAARLGRETLPFKTDVRKLKKLGLTQSFEVGYEISPRGRAFLAFRGTRARAAPDRGSPPSRRK
jgi:hypothetical protein